MIITIEPATAVDAEHLVKVQIAAFHNDAVIYPGVEIGGPPGYDSVESLLQKLKDSDYFKILVEGKIIGGIAVFDLGEGHFHLDLIYVEPAFHNRGIGTRAMHFIEQTYAATKWTLDTPDYAIRNQHFYEKLGYVKVGQEAYPDLTLLAYEKRISGQ